ncbi:hypothetical protein [Pseudomonas urmiensis]|uniref:Uncharacterized protein n=1 Tax=Pseudomonas urmiensis TaxID=2745493 RepID=A0A923JVP1_9PSED|nr:hypothetical protein [Pseudomonas urmiensis]MBV4537365.1 hypothetical protein [Pseudomonas urmiensis]
MKNDTAEKKSGFDKVLVWLALSSIFVSGLYVETSYGILFFSYFLMIVTYVFAIVRIKSFGFRRVYVLLFLSLCAISVLGYVVSGFSYDLDINRLISIFVKIAMLLFFVLFFTAVYDLCGRSAKRLFQRYLDVAFIFSSIGVLQELLFLASGVDFLLPVADGAKNYGTYLGVAGLSVEPAFFACALLPAGSYYVSNFTRTFKFELRAVVVIGAVLLSTSSLGYLGLFISALITIVFGIKLRHAWVLFLIIPLLSFGGYKASQLEFFQMRLNDTLAVIRGAELTMSTGMNISTYSLAVNMSMSLRSIQDNYGFGTGFGTYSAVFDHYINDYEMPNYRDDLPGRGSGTSLFARLTAELGVAGWLLFLISLIWCWREIRGGDTPAISIAYTATLMIILLRMGEYYVNGVVLVFMMIYWLHLEGHRRRVQTRASKDFVKVSGHLSQ